MDVLLQLISSYGLWVVLIAVFLDQGGVPVPAYPPIIVTAALAQASGAALWPILAVAAGAALAADLIWFFGGRRLGARLLRIMCRLSLSPDSCVSQTRGVYARWGAPSLVIAKFVPGFAAVATTLAGEMRTGVLRFAFFDGLGALLWAGAAVALGAFFHEAVADVLRQLETLGRVALPLLGLLLLGFVAVKWLQRRHFLQQIRMARVGVKELYELLQSGATPLLLDVRSSAQRRDGWIPGARHVPDIARLERGLDGLDPRATHEVIVYCDCPNEASAALVALALRRRGFRRVRPLSGGLTAWIAEGYAVEREPAHG
jgi:membrane protein DedA with SNARE-associated domain/rhodanese-related sulfurtransferase